MTAYNRRYVSKSYWLSGFVAGFFGFGVVAVCVYLMLHTWGSFVEAWRDSPAAIIAGALLVLGLPLWWITLFIRSLRTTKITGALQSMVFYEYGKYPQLPGYFPLWQSGRGPRAKSPPVAVLTVADEEFFVVRGKELMSELKIGMDVELSVGPYHAVASVEWGM